MTTSYGLGTGLLIFSMLPGLLASCSRGNRDAHVPPTSGDASLSMMLMAGADLEGAPGIYELIVTSAPGATAVVRSGDIPAPGQILTIVNLPTSAAAELAGNLYAKRIDPTTRTHSCRGDAPVLLEAGKTATASLTCTAVTGSATSIRVFVKVAKATIEITERTAVDVLAAREWSLASQFGAQEEKGFGRRISLKQELGALTVHMGGDMSYRISADSTKPAPLARMIAGETLTLTAIGGRYLSLMPQDATLSLATSPVLYEQESGNILAALPLKLINATSQLGFDATLIEEAVGSEFTVASLNVENLFDDADEERNASYGDYRITPNAQGVGSNYGEPVVFEGQTVRWSDVKIAGVRKTLLALDTAGPEVVGLLEVESHAALEKLFNAVKDLGYVAAQFTDWPADMAPSAIGLGLISKFPISSYQLLPVVFAAAPTTPLAAGGSERPILKVTLDVHGKALIVYVNHWKSKGGPESMRIACAEAVQKDIEALLEVDALADYVILGDMNSEYNEATIIEPVHNDANGRTGINHVLKAQGDEVAVAKNRNPSWKYNLAYELDRAARRTAWHAGFNWSALDNIIVGAGVYDRKGISYVDNSFQPVNALMPGFGHLFKADGTTNRWRSVRTSSNFTEHQIGGYSDHLPISARFHVPTVQSSQIIWLGEAGRPNADDVKLD